jgi:hypothetical protein
VVLVLFSKANTCLMVDRYVFVVVVDIIERDHSTPYSDIDVSVPGSPGSRILSCRWSNQRRASCSLNHLTAICCTLLSMSFVIERI